MTGYIPRVIDTELDELLADLPAISVTGPKGVGKTATARRRATTIFELDDSSHRELLSANRTALPTPCVSLRRGSYAYRRADGIR